MSGFIQGLTDVLLVAAGVVSIILVICHYYYLARIAEDIRDNNRLLETINDRLKSIATRR